MAGSAEGFKEFATSCSGRLFRTAWLLTGDWHLAEDLVQETLGKVYRAWTKRSRPDDPVAYARTTLVRTFITHRRRRGSAERPSDALPDLPAGETDVALRVTLIDTLARLDAKDRAVLVLRYWEDRSVDETAAELGLSAGAVRSRSFRALDRLRAVLGTDGLTPTTQNEVS
ncbi:SigE family RNA polymerase sigma factor [Jiangella rhizosphaerae]|uniref:SigE family RNA polymerase sigma factor n=1 Tax=Jiangella rhizosphaerae TaxID=2293569 RepID=A0A418KPQ5_9ACTN|nr:SigE family RNA polymerase sigma factor [Jiangella rhizosphaerae]RIQ21495.1 SigE family RNA polymerase sigma factor [Jiangella rhizosphaerae]